MANILIEICCGSVADAEAAEQGGAARIELCSALALGGLTPSGGTMRLTRKSVSLPIMTLIRPRAGGFAYSASEFAVMESDIDHALENGADGIVFGVLQPNGRIDVPRTRQLRSRIGDKQAVFHRAFDVTPDPFRALEELIDLGITRLLTSGQQNAAPDGAALIRRLAERAEGRIELMPGGGVTPANALSLIEATGCTQLHSSASIALQDISTSARPTLCFGGKPVQSETEYKATDVALVRALAGLGSEERT